MFLTPLWSNSSIGIALACLFGIVVVAGDAPQLLEVNSSFIALSHVLLSRDDGGATVAQERLTSLEAQLGDDANNPRFLWLAAHWYQLAGLPQRSISVYEALLAQHRYREREVAVELARLHYGLGDTTSAARYWAQAGACVELNRAASAAVREEAWQDARILTEAVLSVRPYNVEAVSLLAVALQGAGDPGSAIDILDDAIANAPHPEPSWWLTKARIQEDTGDWDGAMLSCDRALQLDAASAEALGCLGRTLCYGKGQPEAALPLLGRAIELDPDNVWNYVVLGDAYLSMQDYSGAEAAYRAGADAVSDSEVPLVWLARLYTRRGDLSAAEYHLELAVARQPYSGLAHLDYGLLLRAQGLTDEAIRQLETALQSQPDHLETLLALAEAYEFEGHRDQAVQMYARVAQIDPGNEMAVLALEGLSGSGEQ